MARPQKCPDCGARMLFAPDGRSLVCEKCQRRDEVTSRRRTPAEIARQQIFSLAGGEETSRFRPNVRDLLLQGIAAAKAGDKDEAHFYLESVLLKDSSESEQAQAWLWLSGLCEAPEDKRECLVQTLAINPNHASARRAIAILDGRLSPDDIVDPESVAPPSPDQIRPVQAAHYRCPGCAAPMSFKPEQTLLRCDFCGYEGEIPADAEPSPELHSFGIGPLEQDFIAAMATAQGHLKPIWMRNFTCEGCAVEFSLGPETISLTCPYCGAVYVTETAETREVIPPHALIPFALHEDEAERAVRQWLADRDLKPPKIAPLIGIYLPVWTFDISGELRWSGLESNGDSWVPVSESYYLLLDDVAVSASRNVPPNFDRALPRFDFEHSRPYDAAFLADWPAERYQLALSDASIAARKQILDGLRRQPTRLTSGRSISDLRISSRGMAINSFKLVLVPVWLGHYRLDGQEYPLIVTGQNGAVIGSRPEGLLDRLVGWLRG